ncbi:MAG: VWA domain-containing protein [Pseudomonadota bacterium]
MSTFFSNPESLSQPPLPTALPHAARTFVEFAQILRVHGFAVSPDQTTGFLQAIDLLGPRTIADIHSAGRALFSIPRVRWAEYDALFRAHFLGQTVVLPEDEAGDEEVEAHDAGDDTRDVLADDDESETGEETTTGERLSQREFLVRNDSEALIHLSRQAPRVLPRRQTPRRRAAKRGDGCDLRKSLRQAIRRDGEVFTLAQTKNKTRQRPIVLLVDVSGSMQDQSEAMMRLAHRLVQAAERAEVFSLGTRLTRITQALKPKNEAQALQQVAETVADFDGGTRIGDGLNALLAVPRFAGRMRGAVVVVISDGLERGSPDAMVDAVTRISRLAWRLDWLTPLASDPSFAPRTEALSLSLPSIDQLGSAATLSQVVDHVLHLADGNRRRWAA